MDLWPSGLATIFNGAPSFTRHEAYVRTGTKLLLSLSREDPTDGPQRVTLHMHGADLTWPAAKQSGTPVQAVVFLDDMFPDRDLEQHEHAALIVGGLSAYLALRVEVLSS